MKSISRSCRVALAILATITLAACSGGQDKSATDGKVKDRVAASSEELAKALNIAVPEGYMLQPDQVGDTGPADLEKAIRDDGAADARDVLTRTRFVRGYQRMWSQTEKDEIVTYVYQFADNSGAVEYTQRVTADASAQSPGVTVSNFPVPDIDGATGVLASDPTFATASVTFAKGPYSVQVVVTGANATGLQAMVTALADEQHSRL